MREELRFRLGAVVVASIFVSSVSAGYGAYAQTSASSQSSFSIWPKALTDGLFPQAGKTLQDFGVTLGGVFVDAFSANPNMGAYPNHTANSGILIPEVDLDLGKAAGIKGMQLHFAYTIFTLKSGSVAQFVHCACRSHSGLYLT